MNARAATSFSALRIKSGIRAKTVLAIISSCWWRSRNWATDVSRWKVSQVDKPIMSLTVAFYHIWRQQAPHYYNIRTADRRHISRIQYWARKQTYTRRRGIKSFISIWPRHYRNICRDNFSHWSCTENRTWMICCVCGGSWWRGVISTVYPYLLIASVRMHEQCLVRMLTHSYRTLQSFAIDANVCSSLHSTRISHNLHLLLYYVQPMTITSRLTLRQN